MIYSSSTTSLNIHNIFLLLLLFLFQFFFINILSHVRMFFQIYVCFATAASQFYKLNCIYESFSIFFLFIYLFYLFFNFCTKIFPHLRRSMNLEGIFHSFFISYHKSNFWCFYMLYIILFYFFIFLFGYFVCCWCQYMNISYRFLLILLQSTPPTNKFMLHVIFNRAPRLKYMRGMDLCVYLIEINVVINFHQRFSFSFFFYVGELFRGFPGCWIWWENLNRKIDKK